MVFSSIIRASANDIDRQRARYGPSCPNPNRSASGTSRSFEFIFTFPVLFLLGFGTDAVVCMDCVRNDAGGRYGVCRQSVSKRRGLHRYAEGLADNHAWSAWRLKPLRGERIIRMSILERIEECGLTLRYSTPLLEEALTFRSWSNAWHPSWRNPREFARGPYRTDAAETGTCSAHLATESPRETHLDALGLVLTIHRGSLRRPFGTLCHILIVLCVLLLVNRFDRSRR